MRNADDNRDELAFQEQDDEDEEEINRMLQRSRKLGTSLVSNYNSCDYWFFASTPFLFYFLLSLRAYAGDPYIQVVKFMKTAMTRKKRKKNK